TPPAPPRPRTRARTLTLTPPTRARGRGRTPLFLLLPLPAARCLLPLSCASCLVPCAPCLLPRALCLSSCCPLPPIAHCRLPIALRTLYLIDGHAQMFRGFHAIRSPMSSPVTREPTNATFA